MPRRTPIASIALAAGTLLLSGCGDDPGSKEEYAEATGQVLRPLVAELRSLPDVTGGVSSPRQLSRRLAGVRELLPESIEGLERISPPGDVEDIHADLTEVLREFGTSVTALHRADRSGDELEIVRATAELFQGWDLLQEGLVDFRRRAEAAGVPARRGTDQDDESE